MSNERTTNQVDLVLGQRVRARRMSIGMSQETLAEKSGVTFQQIQKYEKGVNRIAASRLFVIANALDLKIGAFFENLVVAGIESQPTEERLDVSLAVEGSVELLTVYAAIPNAKIRQRILKLVRAMGNDAT